MMPTPSSACAARGQKEPAVASILLLYTGVVAGVAHVLLGADHVAVLAPFSVDARRDAWSVGMRWGLGHAFGVITVALVVRLLAQGFSFDVLHAYSDAIVGVVLVAVGGWGLVHARARASAVAGPHVHVHVHARAALSLGALHGLLGTGSTLAVLPTAGMHTWSESLTYLGAFALGTIGAMSAVAAGLGLFASLRESEQAQRRILTAASALALGFGVLWLALAALGVDVHRA